VDARAQEPVDPTAWSSRLSGENRLTVPAGVLQATGLTAGARVRIRQTGPDRFEVSRWHSRFDNAIGTIPGFERDVDVETSRDGWGQ